MRTAGLVGCHRRRRVGLTRRDPKVGPIPDLVARRGVRRLLALAVRQPALQRLSHLTVTVKQSDASNEPSSPTARKTTSN
jgi:hypothetical protein